MSRGERERGGGEIEELVGGMSNQSLVMFRV